MAQKTGNEETEFKVAPPCINSRAATKTPPPPETPPQITSSSSPSPLTSSSHNLTSSSPSPSVKSLISASSRSSPVVTSHMLTNASSPLEKASTPVMKSCTSHPSSVPVEYQRCSQLTSSSPLTLTSSSTVMKLGDPAKEKRKLIEEEVSLSMPMKRKVNRCSCCSKKVGLTGFRCRCGQLFCSAHRYSDRHDCSFDYKSAGREAIARENPVIKAAKVLKI